MLDGNKIALFGSFFKINSTVPPKSTLKVPSPSELIVLFQVSLFCSIAILSDIGRFSGIIESHIMGVSGVDRVNSKSELMIVNPNKTMKSKSKPKNAFLILFFSLLIF